ncbi:MAG: bifunctional diguanylate cyclase/phosphodiesterase [Desulfurivibrio sp.]|nr:bifunctional diguanylate cyclase/phosphodiesterase [Desulfurivibrio sp.]
MFMQLLNKAMEIPDERDWLTGLPNRHRFRGLLNQVLNRDHSPVKHKNGDQEALTAVMLLDIDRFKAVNNSFGHDIGDQLLNAVGARLRRKLADTERVARFGGDEFGILLTGLHEPVAVGRRATEILQLLAPPFSTADCREVTISASLGITYCPARQQTTPEALLRQANMALELAKQVGGNSHAFFSQEIESRHLDDLILHDRLRQALANDQLQLLYQPQIDIADGRVVGAEALLRWHDEELGQVPPDRFIPVAEATGLISPISDWVLAKACQQLADWQEAGLDWRMAVNLSVQQFRRPDLIAKLQQILRHSGAPPQRLELEVTETAAMDNLELAGRQLVELKALGVKIALDDFGTGYSSLAYLKNLPINTLKIDRTFIGDLEDDHQNRMIVKTIIDLGRGLDMNLVAEGVENEAQLAFLHQHGCQSCQGWLFSPALTAKQLTTHYNKEKL